MKTKPTQLEVASEIKDLVVKALKELDLKVSVDQVDLQHPSDPKFGDYATNIALALFAKSETRNPKLEIKNPLGLAKKIVSELEKNINHKSSIINCVEAVTPGFINFHLSENYLVSQASKLLEAGEFKKRLGKSGKGKTMVIDYSAPNIAKPFGIGHLRSTNIGQAIYNLYSVLGWETIGDNHLGDWGTQFGKLIYKIKIKIQNSKFKNRGPKLLENLTIEELEKLYVEFHKEAEKNPQMEEEARGWFKKLEEGDEWAKKIWQKCIDVSLKEFDRVYQILGVKIDHAYGESFYHYQGWMKKVLEDARAKSLLIKSEGALVIKLPGQKVPAMMVKSDGATTYLLRDLATIKFRVETWRPDLVIYEVGADQKLHFQQVFKAAQLLGYLPAEKLVHIAHGMIRWKDGKFSTRKGKTIHLEEVINEGVDRAKKLVENSQTGQGLDEKEKQSIARAVGIGGIKFNDLKQEPQRDIIFDWDKILSIEGYSAPYLQYTYARAQSVLRKSEIRNPKSETSSKFQIPNYKLNKEELGLLREFYQFEEVIAASAKNFSLQTLCQYLFGLAQKFNLFYQKNRILKSKMGQGRVSPASGRTDSPGVTRQGSNFRLALTQVTANILKMGLEILGIEVLERM